METLVENLMLNRLGAQKRPCSIRDNENTNGNPKETQLVSKLLSYIHELHLRKKAQSLRGLRKVTDITRYKCGQRQQKRQGRTASTETREASHDDVWHCFIRLAASMANMADNSSSEPGSLVFGFCCFVQWCHPAILCHPAVLQRSSRAASVNAHHFEGLESAWNPVGRVPTLASCSFPSSASKGCSRHPKLPT